MPHGSFCAMEFTGVCAVQEKKCMMLDLPIANLGRQVLHRSSQSLILYHAKYHTYLYLLKRNTTSGQRYLYR